jgi:YaiO family outer membrane protein
MSFSQDLAYSGNPDKSFFAARDLAFDGKRATARDTLNRILTKYPDYTDVRNLLAKTLSWDGQHKEARKQFNRITSVERKNKEAWLAAVKNEIYAQEYYIALGIANKALTFIKNDEQLLVLKDYAHKNIHTKKVEHVEKESNKQKTISGVLIPIAKKDSLESLVYSNQIGISTSFDVFDMTFEPMIYTSIEYKRVTKAGSIIPRINYSNRFQTHGVQYEIDFYPKFSKTFYGYLNYGFSNASIFPKHRVGAELYANLPKGIEVSAGFRFLDFLDTKATIYTGSVGLYSGNYYFSLRPYVVPSDRSDLGFSGELLARRYLKDADNYLGLRAGMGFLPELKQLRNGNELLAETLFYVESQQLQFEYQFTGWMKMNKYKTNLGITRQEFISDSGNYFWAVSAGITCQVKF